MKLEDKIILLISPEAWGHNYVSKHHYANYLSQKNKVYFLNPATSPLKNKPGKMNIQTETVQNNLHIVSYNNLLPRLNNLPKAVQRSVYKKQAKKIIAFLGESKPDIIWSFDPFRYFDLGVWQVKRLIYHTVDVHFNKCYEHDIAASADLVLLSSELLRKNLSSSNSNIHYTGHAADIDHFSSDSKVTPKLPGNKKVKAGLIGNFNHNVDYDLIRNIATHNPEIDFVFVGPYSTHNLGEVSSSIEDQVNEINKMDNAHFIGSVPSEEIISWLNVFDINLVLYKEEKRNIIINPHKMMGYFYSGKITICSWFNEYKDSDPEFVYVSKNNHEIPDIIKKVNENLPHWNQEDFMKKRRKFAIDNSYPNKLLIIEDLLKQIK